ncbi:MAG: hypothetical protein ACLRIL_01795 [Fusicatenibacter saccharivorans]
MRKRIAMVLLGLSLAVGTPAATNMFPTVSAQTVQAAGKPDGRRSPEPGIFTKTV